MNGELLQREEVVQCQKLAECLYSQKDVEGTGCLGKAFKGEGACRVSQVTGGGFDSTWIYSSICQHLLPVNRTFRLSCGE